MKPEPDPPRANARSPGSAQKFLWKAETAAGVQAPRKVSWRRVLRDLGDDNVMGLAAQTAFFFALSLFPFLIFLGGLVGILPMIGAWHPVLKWITLYLPKSSQMLVFNTVAGLTPHGEEMISIGFVGVVWSASGGILSLMSSLNTCYDVQETRPLWKRMGITLLMLFVLGLLFIGSFALLTVGHLFAEWVNRRISSDVALPIFWRVGHWVLSMFMLIIGMDVIDYFFPNRKQRWHWITPGTILAMALWIPGSLGFNFYVGHVGSYSREYGALGAFMVLMVWIYLISAVILAGAEINYELMQRSAG